MKSCLWLANINYIQLCLPSAGFSAHCELVDCSSSAKHIAFVNTLCRLNYTALFSWVKILSCHYHKYVCSDLLDIFFKFIKWRKKICVRVKNENCKKRTYTLLTSTQISQRYRIDDCGVGLLRICLFGLLIYLKTALVRMMRLINRIINFI